MCRAVREYVSESERVDEYVSWTEMCERVDEYVSGSE